MAKKKNNLKSKGERLGWKKTFIYCQSQIEDGKKCNEQCNHCKEYYKELENEYRRIKVNK